MNLAVLDKSSEKDVESASLLQEGHQASIKTTHFSSSMFSPLFRFEICNEVCSFFFFSFTCHTCTLYKLEFCFLNHLLLRHPN